VPRRPRWPLFEDIIGSWVSDYGHDYYGDYDILGTDAVRYDFYIDHTGRYTYYSTWGQEYIDFDWYAYGDQLQINYYDGSYENLYYGFDNWGYLLLSPYYNFSEYTGYRPAM